MNLAGFIRKERARKKWSMRELSRKAKVTLSYLSNIENNNLPHEPNKDMVYRLLEALEIEDSDQKMLEFGLIEEENENELFKTRKRKIIEGMKSEINQFLDGMDIKEIEGMLCLLKKNYELLEMISFDEKSEENMQTFKEYLEFQKYKEELRKS